VVVLVLMSVEGPAVQEQEMVAEAGQIFEEVMSPTGLVLIGEKLEGAGQVFEEAMSPIVLALVGKL
jgi:hypothetical protein